jgi:replicative DNA helicase
MSGEILAYPQQLESERAYLGGIMLVHDRAEQLDLLEQMPVEDYFASSHRSLHGLMLDMARRGLAVDVMTVPEKVMGLSHLQQEDMGGIGYLSKLTAMVPGLSNLARYRKGIQGAAQLRRLLDTAKEIERLAVSGIEPKVAVEMSEDLISRMRQGTSGDDFVLASELFVRAWEDAERRSIAAQAGDHPTLTTPWNSLTEKFAGAEAKKLTIIAGRPAMGKSALAGELAAWLADREGVHDIGVGVFNMEMAAEQQAHRWVSSKSGINGMHIVQGLRNTDRLTDYAETACQLGDRLRIAFDDTSLQTVATIKSKARRMDVVMRREYGVPLGAIFIDYLTLLDMGGGGGANRAELVGKASRAFKVLAGEMDIPVFVLAQLNRKCEDRADKRPMISDLRDSGAIEQDADSILFLYRDEVYNPTTTQEPGVLEVIIAKQRSGWTGTVKLGWEAEFTRITDEPPNRPYRNVSGLAP